MPAPSIVPRNERGQAAIFVALMFNVFFVFFAMAINVALVVHDKINLQNSLDMAAYYAAMKQAEILNVIAHENYMIRQSYKLLAWRYRVMGIMGYYKNLAQVHPIWTGETSDTVFDPATRPTVCIDFQPTWGLAAAPPGENLCNQENVFIPKLPQVQVIAGFIGQNIAIAELSKALIAQFKAECDTLAAADYWWAMSIWHAFRLDQRNRMQVITALANDLKGSGNDGDFIDLDGNSVLAGAKETFVKNLTYANRLSFEGSGGSFQMLNSLSGVDVNKWLPQIQIASTITYTATKDDDNCIAVVENIATLPPRVHSQELLEIPYGQGGFGMKDLEAWGPVSIMDNNDKLYQFTIGVEKNPWYMAYMGVQASTTPRQIFFPMAGGVPMTGRAFAKPFGGRIGPWYYSKWEQSDPTSTGTANTLVDPLMAPRYLANGPAVDANDPRRLPNYSRFPGDQNGLTTKLALDAINGMNTVVVGFDYYKNIKADMAPGNVNDPLAWDDKNNTAPDIRNYELAAIAPDLFDITYYSIEPDFTDNYWTRLKANATKLGVDANVPIRQDLGASAAQPNFAIKDQMLGKPKQAQKTEAYYFIKNKTHLLTAWLPGPGAFNYKPDEALANFGKCALPDDTLKFKTPGSCVAGGGRTGYSVKIISRDALLSNQHKIGGDGAAPGAILNPPPEGW